MNHYNGPNALLTGPVAHRSAVAGPVPAGAGTSGAAGPGPRPGPGRGPTPSSSPTTPPPPAMAWSSCWVTPLCWCAWLPSATLAAAISEAARCQPDVALLDVLMPGGGGLAAAVGIREVSPRTRVVAYSAAADRSTVVRCCAAGPAATC